MATNQSLRAVREQILFACPKNIIDADEFLLLYDANQSIYLSILEIQYF